jgi:hypothetical protein
MVSSGHGETSPISWHRTSDMYSLDTKMLQER